MVADELRGQIQGTRADLRRRLPEVFDVCREIIDYLFDLDTGVVLQVGRADGPFTEERWRVAEQRLARGQSKQVVVSRDVYFPGGHHSSAGTGADRVQVQIDVDFEFAEDVGLIELEVDRERDRPVDDDTAVSWLVKLAQASGLAQASLHPRDFLVPLDAPEAAVRYMHVLQDGLRDHGVHFLVTWPSVMLERFARGAAWGLYLTHTHIDGLGGIDAVKEHAPVRRVIETPPGIWMELTDDPTRVTADEMLALEAYLSPILPTVDDVLALVSTSASTKETEIAIDDADRYIESHTGAVPIVEGRIDFEMTVGIECDAALTPAARAAIERCAKAWIEDGTHGLFGGDFHGWIPGDWDDASYELDVDTGAHEIDWDSALTELARRLGGCAAAHDFSCSLRVGWPI